MSTILKVSFVGHGPDLEQLVLTHFLANSDVGTNAAVFSDNAHLCFTHLMTPILPFMCGEGSYTHQKTVLTEVGTTDGPFSIDDYTDEGVQNSGVSAPANIALAAVMQKRTFLAGRRGRGRLFIPFAAAASFSLNGVADFSTYGALSDITDAWSSVFNLAGEEGPAPFLPVIFHRGLLTSTQIVSCAFSTRMGVQRRRRVGIGA